MREMHRFRSAKLWLSEEARSTITLHDLRLVSPRWWIGQGEAGPEKVSHHSVVLPDGRAREGRADDQAR
jgi:hypothetical protein